MSELREKIARALYCASGGERTYGPWDSSGEIVVSMRSYFLRHQAELDEACSDETDAEPDGDREWQIATAPDGRWLPAEEWKALGAIEDGQADKVRSRRVGPWVVASADKDEKSGRCGTRAGDDHE